MFLRFGSVLVLIFSLLGFSSCFLSQNSEKRAEDQIKEILKLETSEFVYRNILYRSISESFIGITTRETRALAELNIKVLAGIELDKDFKLIFSDQNIFNPENKAVKVILPSAKILAADADETSIKQYFLQEYGLFKEGRLSLLEFGDQLKNNKDLAVKDAIKRGILEKAQKNAERVIKKSFTSQVIPLSLLIISCPPQT